MEASAFHNIVAGFGPSLSRSEEYAQVALILAVICHGISLTGTSPFPELGPTDQLPGTVEVELKILVKRARQALHEAEAARSDLETVPSDTVRTYYLLYRLLQISYPAQARKCL